MKLNILKYKRIRLFIIPLGFLIFNDLSAQVKIEGVIIDENRTGMAGATILEINTSHGVDSETEGVFSIMVSDTSRLQITFIGYYDTVIVVKDFLHDTIQMRPMPLDPIEYSMICPHYYNTLNFGYFGDVDRMPYGLTFYYFRPYLFGKPILFNTHMTYKTDFSSNSDFLFQLGKSDIIRKDKYRLSSSFYFHYRDLIVSSGHYRINDYELILRNYFFNFLHLSGGILMRNDFGVDSDFGGVIEIDASIWKTLSHLTTSVTLINSDYEYSIALYQRFVRNKRILNGFQFGVEYKSYLNYNELNLLLRYSLN